MSTAASDSPSTGQLQLHGHCPGPGCGEMKIPRISEAEKGVGQCWGTWTRNCRARARPGSVEQQLHLTWLVLGLSGERENGRGPDIGEGDSSSNQAGALRLGQKQGL